MLGHTRPLQGGGGGGLVEEKSFDRYEKILPGVFKLLLEVWRVCGPKDSCEEGVLDGFGIQSVE